MSYLRYWIVWSPRWFRVFVLMPLVFPVFVIVGLVSFLVEHWGEYAIGYSESFVQEQRKDFWDRQQYKKRKNGQRP